MSNEALGSAESKIKLSGPVVNAANVNGLISAASHKVKVRVATPVVVRKGVR
ncbi:hypothetical protein [Saccharothrix variisporea]|uniref:Uncharacterized protein n=1 Tax=Saccharothrix variisporea TaxID=543527 RepID=A0A495X894_9PSEU|nr:hypothetical protein [Saccharothrix variisporea]RKT70167.1 hypothetical protein DFJ66_3414 [Saccharothrix variisporea]